MAPPARGCLRGLCNGPLLVHDRTALANKNVRTAWALLMQGAVYDRDYGGLLAAA
ncbi:MAG: hypothetical protein ABFS24_03130 [Pseudomonadota bacterium]